MVAITFFSPSPISAKRGKNSAKREIQKFEEFIRIMDNNYIDSLDYHYLIEVAICAILDQTDPYSAYLKDGEVKELAQRIDSPAIDTAYMLNSSTACIKVGLFSQDTANDIERIYKEFGSPERLVLDLRGNKGGLVTEAIKTANLFFEKGVPILKRSRRNRAITTHMSQYDGELIATDLIVVIDRESASASEIVATALQSNKRALIVGERSYGKALIISPFTLNDGSIVLIATAQYTTPIGEVIQRSYRGRKSNEEDGGIIPDIIFKSDEVIDNKDFIMFIASTHAI